MSNIPKDILSFITEDTNLEILPNPNYTTSHDYFLSHKEDLKVTLISLYELYNILSFDQIKFYLDLKHIKICNYNNSNSKLITVDKSRRTGKTFLVKVLALYELYLLTFDSHREKLKSKFCLKDYQNPCVLIKSIHNDLTFNIVRDIKYYISITKSLNSEDLIVTESSELNGYVLSYNKDFEYSSNVTPILVIKDEYDLLPTHEIIKLKNEYMNKSDVIIVGTAHPLA